MKKTFIFAVTMTVVLNLFSCNTVKPNDETVFENEAENTIGDQSILERIYEIGDEPYSFDKDMSVSIDILSPEESIDKDVEQVKNLF